MLGIDSAVNCRREHDATVFLQPHEGAGPGGILGGDVRSRDGDQPSAVRKTGQSGSDVPQRRICHLAIDMNRGRKRRIHERDTRHNVGIEMVVDVRGVELRRAGGGKELGENAGTAVGEFVEDKRSAGEFGEDGQETSAGRWFQHDVCRFDRCRCAGNKCQPDRRRELLKEFAFLGPTRVGRKQAGDPRQHRQHGGRRYRLGTHGGAIPSEKENSRRLAGVIGGLPVPGAGRIGGAEGGLHRAAQDGGIDAPAAFDIGQKLPRSPYDTGGGKCGGTHRERRGAGAADERFSHGRMSRESGKGSNRSALS